jgi:hypothetical protein
VRSFVGNLKFCSTHHSQLTDSRYSEGACLAHAALSALFGCAASFSAAVAAASESYILAQAELFVYQLRLNYSD